jgi:DNA polymerase elongation subunit (family B)
MGLGRLCARRVWLDEQKLASSALGSNFLKFISLDGVVTIDMIKVLQRDQKLDSYKLDSVATMFLGDQKNDLKPEEIFAKFKGNREDRAEIARYCIQDCCLVNRLLHKLKVLENNVGMGNVCSVPLSYLFMRGQGVKIFSLVAKYCRSLQMLIPVVKNFSEESLDDNGVGYEGAIVLPPKIGMYLEDPITVFDFSSLYPSSMIERDLSHDRILLHPEKYGNLQHLGIEYITVTYDEYSGVGDKKVLSNKKNVVFAKMPNGEKGVIPSILMELLKQRKNTRKKMEYETIQTENGIYTGLVSETDITLTILDVEKNESKSVSISDVLSRKATYNAFEEAVLDALQLAYKITANSLYGQIGARTSPIYLKEIAASTTATGRERIMMAKKFMEDNYQADVIYGDTDSIFCKFPCRDEHGHIVKGREALPLAIRAGQIGAKAIKSILPPPQSLEYEKTLFPFIIFSKKRYVGNLYEDDANKKPKQKSMGIVLKRRDNAPIVKKIYGGIIDCLVNKYSLSQSIDFLQSYLKDIVDGKIPMEDLIITKTLGANYKNPTKIAHRVLVDRMGMRDPGNKPQVNDRIPFVYIVPPEGTDIKLQGDRVEHPDYIRKMNLVPDYRFYLTNQIIKPVCQIYGLCVEQLTGYDCTNEYWDMIKATLLAKSTYENNEKKLEKKLLELREKMATELLFGETLSKLPEVVLTKNKKKSRKTSVLPTVRGKKFQENNTVIQPDIQLKISTDAKEKKKWIGMTEILNSGESIWSQTIEREKGRTKDKISSAPKFYILLCESGLIHLLDKPDWKKSILEKGIELVIDKDTIISELNKSLRQFDEYEATMATIVESGDIGKLTEFRENNLYRNIAGFLKGIQYKVSLQ